MKGSGAGRRRCFRAGFRQRSPLVLIVAAGLTALTLLGLQQAFATGAWSEVPLKYWLRSDETDTGKARVAWLLARLDREPAAERTLFLLGGSTLREATVRDGASLADRVEALGGPHLQGWNLATSLQTFAQSLAIVDNLPSSGSVTVVIGVSPGRFIGDRAGAAQQMEGRGLPLWSATLGGCLGEEPSAGSRRPDDPPRHPQHAGREGALRRHPAGAGRGPVLGLRAARLRRRPVVGRGREARRVRGVVARAPAPVRAQRGLQPDAAGGAGRALPAAWLRGRDGRAAPQRGADRRAVAGRRRPLPAAGAEHRRGARRALPRLQRRPRSARRRLRRPRPPAPPAASCGRPSWRRSWRCSTSGARCPTGAWRGTDTGPSEQGLCAYAAGAEALSRPGPSRLARDTARSRGPGLGATCSCRS